MVHRGFMTGRSTTTSTLSYAQRTLSSPFPFYKTAVLCGAAPLVVGTAIFLFWLLTGWEWLMMAGTVTIGCGVLCFLAGAVCLVIESHRLSPATALEDRHDRRRQRRGWLLLLVNFPVAFAILVAVIAIRMDYVVVLVNVDPVPIDRFVLVTPDGNIDLDRIPASGRVRVRPPKGLDGPLRFESSQNGVQSSGEIDSYMLQGWTLTVTMSGGTPSVSKRKSGPPYWD